MLIRCRRYCCVCGKWCGSKITIHHIDGNDDNSEDNGIPVCFDCHAEIVSYNKEHPIGRKFQPSELIKLRNLTYAKYTSQEQKIPEGTTDYGHGFHAGAIWSEKRNILSDIWRFISVYGDFALEILIMFDEDNICTMMDETLWNSNVQTGESTRTGRIKTQEEGHSDAWHVGQIIGLWDLDNDTEMLFLSKRGIIFKELVKSDPKLLARFKQLKDFWDKINRHENDNFVKPKQETIKLDDFPPGPLNWLRFEINKLARINGQDKEIYTINNVTVNKVELKSVDNGSIITIDGRNILEVDVDHNSAELIIKISK